MDQQTFRMTGQIMDIHEAKTIQTKGGRFLTSRKIMLKQHSDDMNEVPKSFTIQDKQQSVIHGFKTGDHVGVFFNIKTFLNKQGYPTTTFNVFKIEKSEAPAPEYRIRNQQNR